MKIVLSTNNPSKKEQAQAMFAGSGIQILSLEENGTPGAAVEDKDGGTLEQNAFKKAVFAHAPGCWAMADDTGIFIDALDGRPGGRTADWSGDAKTTEEKTGWILEQLKDVANRSATFRTVVVVLTPSGNRHFFTGEVHGSILRTARCKPQPQMAYSPIFQPDGSKKVWAEMTIEEENAISHRGKAFCQARQFLEQTSR